jgi:hypothetical protein
MPSIDSTEAPVAHNEGSGDPNIDSYSMYDTFDAMDDFEAPDYEEAQTGEPESKTESYQAEGEGELRDPFCGV